MTSCCLETFSPPTDDVTSEKKQFSYTNQYGYMSRLLLSKELHPMFFTDPLWLTALATLVTSLASLVWAVRRKPDGRADDGEL